MNFADWNRDVLDINFANKTILVNNMRIAQFLEKGERIRGRVDRSKHEFFIDLIKLSEQCEAVGYPVDAARVAAEYAEAMQ